MWAKLEGFASNRNYPYAEADYHDQALGAPQRLDGCGDINLHELRKIISMKC